MQPTKDANFFLKILEKIELFWKKLFLRTIKNNCRFSSFIAKNDASFIDLWVFIKSL
jgi:hypothetical protein